MFYSPSSGWRNVLITVFAGDRANGSEISRVINSIAPSASVSDAIIFVPTPVISAIPGGHYEARFRVLTSADANAVSIRALDTGSFDMAHADWGFINIAQNQREWNITVPIHGGACVDATRFEIEALGGGHVLPGGRHITGQIQFR